MSSFSTKTLFDIVDASNDVALPSQQGCKNFRILVVLERKSVLKNFTRLSGGCWSIVSDSIKFSFEDLLLFLIRCRSFVCEESLELFVHFYSN